LIDFKETPNDSHSAICIHYGQIHQWLDFDKSLHSLLNLLLIDLNRLFEPIPKNPEFSQSFQLVHLFEELVDKHFK
jgi:hypothetical protein